MTKECGRCKDNLPCTTKYFHKNKQSKDGLHSYCKTCRSKAHKEYLLNPVVGDRVRKKVREWQKGTGKEKYTATLKKYSVSPKRILWRRNRKVVADTNAVSLDEALKNLEKAKKEREENPLTWDKLKLRPFKDGRNKHIKNT